MDITTVVQIETRNVMSKEQADALTVRNQEVSPLLRLPGELRNRIYAYVFTEQCILVRRALSSRFQLAVEPHGFPGLRRYPFPDLSVITTVCRQIRAEASLLIFRLNDFRFHHLETMEEFTRSVPRAQRAAIESVRLGLYAPSTDSNIKMLVDCDMGVFAGLRKIIVEMKYWPVAVRDLPPWRDAFQQMLRKTLLRSVGRDIEIVFD